MDWRQNGTKGWCSFQGIEPCISCLPGRSTTSILERVHCVRLTTQGEHFRCHKISSYFSYWILCNTEWVRWWIDEFRPLAWVHYPSGSTSPDVRHWQNSGTLNRYLPISFSLPRPRPIYPIYGSNDFISETRFANN